LSESQSDGLYEQALCLTNAIVKILEYKGIELGSRPIPKLRPIVESNRRMRVTSFNRLHGVTYIAAINFYQDDPHTQKNKALGAVIIYIGEKYIVELFAAMGYPGLDETDENALKDAL